MEVIYRDTDNLVENISQFDTYENFEQHIKDLFNIEQKFLISYTTLDSKKIPLNNEDSFVLMKENLVDVYKIYVDDEINDQIDSQIIHTQENETNKIQDNEFQEPFNQQKCQIQDQIEIIHEVPQLQEFPKNIEPAHNESLTPEHVFSENQRETNIYLTSKQFEDQSENQAETDFGINLEAERKDIQEVDLSENYKFINVSEQNIISEVEWLQNLQKITNSQNDNKIQELFLKNELSDQNDDNQLEEKIRVENHSIQPSQIISQNGDQQKYQEELNKELQDIRTQIERTYTDVISVQKSMKQSQDEQNNAQIILFENILNKFSDSIDQRIKKFVENLAEKQIQQSQAVFEKLTRLETEVQQIKETQELQTLHIQQVLSEQQNNNQNNNSSELAQKNSFFRPNNQNVRNSGQQEIILNKAFIQQEKFLISQNQTNQNFTNIQVKISDSIRGEIERELKQEPKIVNSMTKMIIKNLQIKNVGKEQWPENIYLIQEDQNIQLKMSSVNPQTTIKKNVQLKFVQKLPLGLNNYTIQLFQIFNNEQMIPISEPFNLQFYVEE